MSPLARRVAVPALGLLLVLCLAAPEAGADSWAAPQPTLASSPDGHWYVIVQPIKSFDDVRFQLVKRAEGAEPRRLPMSERSHGARLLKPEKGDVVVAEGPCHMPMKLRCLDGGRGFLLFETYAQLGGRNVLELRDGKGKVVWTRGLTDLFSAEQIRTQFMQTVSSIWWYRGFWMDEAADEIGLVTKTKLGSGLLHVRLRDGKPGPLAPVALLARLGTGRDDERVLALEAAEALQVQGLTAAVLEAYEDASTPPLARAHMAAHLHARGDDRGRDVLADAARPGRPLALRRYAVGQLADVLGKEALPLLEDAMGASDWQLRSEAGKAMGALGVDALPPLVRMVSDTTLDLTTRSGAVQVLWNMGAAAAPALHALKKAEASGPSRLSKSAASAIQAIEKAIEKAVAGDGKKK